MGTISPPFILCPLSDRKELLGMSEDKLPNKVIITIGRNIAIRYYIPEQKQERSWTISQHWLTSRVVYCPEFEKYGAVIDNNMIGLWDEEDTTVNRFRFKLKFDQPVLELLPTKTLGTLVVFRNGFVCGVNKLKSIQEKDTGKKKRLFKGVVENDKESIVDVAVNESDGEVVLTIASQEEEQSSPTKSDTNANTKRIKIVVAKLHLGVNEEEFMGEQELKLDVISDTNIMSKKRKSGKILGHCVIPRDGNSVVYIDGSGKLMERKCCDSASNVEVGSIGNYVSLQSPVVMRCADEGSTLVMYGSDPSEEGAVVFLYDLKYNVLLAKQSLKLYGTPPIMEKVGNNVIVPVGLHMLVLGISITKSLLSAVVAKHRLKAGEEVFEQRNPWKAGPSGWDKLKNQDSKKRIQKNLKLKEKTPEQELQRIKKSFPSFWEYVHQFKTLEKEGQPESVICNQIIPTILANDNIAALDWILDAVTDVPEKLLVQILTFLLKIRQDPVLSQMRISDSKENQPDEENLSDETCFSPDMRINNLLYRDVDERELVRALPSMNYEQVKFFISYLKSMMDYDWPVSTEVHTRLQSEINLQVSASRWIKWISCVLNAHYAKFVINSEIDMVESLLTALDERCKLFDAIEEFSPYFLMTYNKVNIEPRPNPNSKWRSEIITFV